MGLRTYSLPIATEGILTADNVISAPLSGSITEENISGEVT